MIQTLKLLACNGCTEKTNPYRSITILLRYASEHGWTSLKSEGHRTIHFCRKCSAERAGYKAEREARDAAAQS